MMTSAGSPPFDSSSARPALAPPPAGVQASAPTPPWARPGTLAGRLPASDTLVLAALLLIYGTLQYRHVLGMSFALDDYTILDKVATVPFASLWTAEHPLWGWYRPWSRELHFWALTRWFGPDEIAIRLAGLALWGGILVSYFTLLRRIAGASAAFVATLGASTLAAWGGTLGWGAGAQEQWMLLFALGFLHATVRRRPIPSLLALAGALLSKETAAVLPAIALLYALAIDRDRPAAALRRSAPAFALAAIWAALHPFLRARLANPVAQPGAPVEAVSPLEVAGRTLLSVVNLDRWPAPESGWLAAVLPAIPSVLLLAAVAARVTRREPGARDSRRVLAFAGGWLALGTLPLFMPGVGWLSYYALLAALGGWAMLGALLAPRPWVATAVLALVAALQPVHARTPSYEWGSDWFLRRTSYFVDGLERALLQRHPTLPPDSRVFFANCPTGTGIGQPWFNSALRVWYGGLNVHSDFVRNYGMRPAGEPQGRDFFFRFDPATHAWYETVRGPEDIARESGLNPEWEKDHGSLTLLLAGAGDWDGAREELQKLVTVAPSNPQYRLYHAISLGRLGDEAGMRREQRVADSLLKAAGPPPR